MQQAKTKAPHGFILEELFGFFRDNNNSELRANDSLASAFALGNGFDYVNDKPVNSRDNCQRSLQ